MSTPSGSDATRTNSPTVNITVLVADSRAFALASDMSANLAAAALDSLANYEFGNPLTYRDPTGETATWNALLEHVTRERARIDARGADRIAAN